MISSEDSINRTRLPEDDNTQTMAGTTHRNAVLMVADDLGLSLGCYGVSSIETPNLDKLAADGTKFTNAFASTASCSGSRSTIYSGLHTHQNGQYGLAHGWNHFQTHDHVQTLPKIFNSAGFQTGIIGKVHVGPKSVYPWEVYEASQSRNVVENARRAGAFFDKAADTKRPFHLTVGFRDPHRDGTRGGFGNDEEDVKHLAVPYYRESEVEIPEYLPDVPEVRKELVEYYKSVSRLDIGVGLVLQELQKRGLDQNTMVVFVSDNGAPFVNSKTTLYDAGVRLPMLMKIPGQKRSAINPNLVSFLDLIPSFMDWCKVQKPSQEPNEDDMTSPAREGDSVLPIVDASDIREDWKSDIFGSHTFHEIQNCYPTRYMRTHKYKYHRNIFWKLDFPFGTDLYGSLSWEGIRNLPQPLKLGDRRIEDYLQRGPEQLFDMENDPKELNDLAGKPEYAEIVDSMRKELEAWQWRTQDPWFFRDGVSLMASRGYQQQGLQMRDRFDFDPKDTQTVGKRLWSSETLPQFEAPKLG
ncbi:hypothetical protein MBLNU230_g6716t1 [Neophaeotheca triangularis]